MSDPDLGRDGQRILDLPTLEFIDQMRQGVLATDARGAIVAVNRAFTRLTGYAFPEVVGKNPRVLKSGQHGEEFYRDLWRSIQERGHWEGEIWNRRKNGEVYPEFLSITEVKQVAGRVARYVGLFSDITGAKATQTRLQHLAQYDALTDLPNRALLLDRLGRALAYSPRFDQPAAVLLLDLDRFKDINDSLGHRVGDVLLQAVAGRLRRSLRDSDTVGRIGGDEFVVLLPGIARAEGAVRVAEKLVHELSQPFDLGGRSVRISASIGVVVFPDGGRDADALLANADREMYLAKQEGRNRWHLHAQAPPAPGPPDDAPSGEAPMPGDGP